MKGKLHTWIQIGLGILLFALLFLMLSRVSEPTFNKIEFKDNNQVYNKTERQFLDTIVLTGMNALHIKNTSVLVAPLDRTETENDIELKGYIVPTDGGYIIFIKDTDRLESIEIISHELIHLNQLSSGNLKNNKYTVEFLGIKYTKENMPEYMNRPWEQEAFLLQHDLNSKIIKRLY